MKVLITGATGFLGQRLAISQHKKGHDVYCLVRHTSNIDLLKKYPLNLVYGDITDPASLHKAVVSMDIVYHLAIAKSPRDIKTYYQVNTFGTKNLIDACVKLNPKIKKFVYVSSLAAAGYSSKDNPLKETDPPHPITHYGKSKLQGERAVLFHGDKIPVVVLRPPSILGHENMFFAYLNKMIQLGIKPILTGNTSLCYIDDFVHGLTLVAESNASNLKIYFISDGNIYSWKRIVEIMASFGKKKRLMPLHIPRNVALCIQPISFIISKLFHAPQIHSKIKELGYPYWTCDPSKIRTELGFECKTDLETGLRLSLWNNLEL